MTAAIEVRNLHFRYPDGKEALRGVNLAIHGGDCVGLIGPNGAGKSTLLLHFNGVLPETPDASGSVLVFGKPVSRSNLETIRRTVGLLFQDPDDQIFCPTVYEDVAFGPVQFGGLSTGEIERIVRDSLTRVGLQGYEKRSPQHLSRGEKQRVCLAGVLACQPEVLALDEPTSDLDPRGRRELKALLKSIPATKIIASHDLDMIAELCSRVILLDNGIVAAEGPTRELLSDEKLMLAHGLEKPHFLEHPHPH